MNRVSISLLRDFALKAARALKHWLYTLRSKPAISERLNLVAVALVTGFIIACAHALPGMLQREASPAQAMTSQTAPAPNPIVDTNAPAQDDARFATHPAWSQNYVGRTSGTPDPLYWNVLVGPAQNSNEEQQYYTDKLANLNISGGALHLVATHQSQPDGYAYGSSRIETQGKKSFLYGRIDISAKLPSGSGTWPAVWMLPDNETYAQKSPKTDTLRYKNGGEIDIIESVGFQPDVVYGVAHTLSDVSAHPDGTGSYKTVTVPNSSTEFNTYTLYWTPTSLTFAVNGAPYYTYTRKDGADYTTWPFDQPFYLIANLAMGGTWGGMDTKNFPGNGIDNKALPASFDIRSIYYYPYVGTTAVK